MEELARFPRTYTACLYANVGKKSGEIWRGEGREHTCRRTSSFSDSMAVDKQLNNSSLPISWKTISIPSSPSAKCRMIWKACSWIPGSGSRNSLVHDGFESTSPEGKREGHVHSKLMPSYFIHNLLFQFQIGLV